MGSPCIQTLTSNSPEDRQDAVASLTSTSTKTSDVASDGSANRSPQTVTTTSDETLDGSGSRSPTSATAVTATSEKQRIAMTTDVSENLVTTDVSENLTTTDVSENLKLVTTKSGTHILKSDRASLTEKVDITTSLTSNQTVGMTSRVTVDALFHDPPELRNVNGSKLSLWDKNKVVS